MKLQDIIKENKEENLERLNQLLQTKFRNKNQELLWRGSTLDINDWKIRDIRKNRNPKDTTDPIHHIIDGVTEGFHDEFPKRSESKFASTSQHTEKLNEYGPNLYIVFPSNDSKIISWRKDTYNFLNMAHIRINNYQKLKNLSEKAEEKGYENLFKFTKLYYLAYTGLSKANQSLKEFVSESWRKLNKEARRAEKDFNLEKLIEGLKYIQKYFTEGEIGIVDNSEEIMFDGKKYIAVDPDYFKENFRWNGNNWELVN